MASVTMTGPNDITAIQDAYLQKLQAKDREQKRVEERTNDQPNAENRKDRRDKPR